MNESRYYVWCQTRDLPVVIHDTLESAREESRRLAQKTPEVDFMIVRAVENVKYTEYPFRITNFCKG